MSFLPKLEESLFFKQQILGYLLNQLQINPLQENLLLDPTIFDSLSNPSIVSQELNQQFIIDYEHIMEATNITNWNSFSFSQLSNNQDHNGSSECKKLYFTHKTIKQIIFSLNIYSQKDQNVSYISCFEDSKLDQNTIYRKIYLLSSESQNLKVTPCKINQVQIPDHINLETNKYLGLQIVAIHFQNSQQKLKTINILLKLNNKQIIKYNLQSMTLQQKKLPHLNHNLFLSQIVIQHYYFTEQLKYLNIQNQIKTHLYFDQEEANKLPRKNIYHNSYQSKAQILFNQSAYNVDIRTFVRIIEIMKYFYYQLSVSIGSVEFATICFQEAIPFFIDFSKAKKANKELFAYDITLLLSLITKNSEQSWNYGENQIRQLMDDIISTGNPQLLIQKFEELYCMLKLKI